MKPTGLFAETGLLDPPSAAVICRGRVTAVRERGHVEVTCEDQRVLLCDVLQTSDYEALQLSENEAVLVWAGEPQDDRGVILGRIGPSHAPTPRPPEVPDELVIESKQRLTLKCGEGSITLRGDGKILIKGKDLVSHAKQMNRIKGGGVGIN